MTHPVDKKISALADEIAAAAMEICGPDRLDEAVRVLKKSRYLDVPAPRKEPDTASSASRQHYIDTGRYLPEQAAAGHEFRGTELVPGWCRRCGCSREMHAEESA